MATLSDISVGRAANNLDMGVSQNIFWILHTLRPFRILFIMQSYLLFRFFLSALHQHSLLRTRSPPLSRSDSRRRLTQLVTVRTDKANSFLSFRRSALSRRRLVYPSRKKSGAGKNTNLHECEREKR